jgi:hypothetical protein
MSIHLGYEKKDRTVSDKCTKSTVRVTFVLGSHEGQSLPS